MSSEAKISARRWLAHTVTLALTLVALAVAGAVTASPANAAACDSPQPLRSTHVRYCDAAKTWGYWYAYNSVTYSKGKATCHYSKYYYVTGQGAVEYVGAASVDCSTLGERVVNRAWLESENTTRNREQGPNCSWYSGFWGSGDALAACQTAGGYKWRSVDWCANFVKYVWYVAGANISGIDAWAGSFYRRWVGTSQYRAKSSGYVPKAGDAVLFDWDWSGEANGWNIDHVAIVVSYNTSTGKLTTIEGNTTPDSGTTQGVFIRTNRTTSNVVGYVIPTT